MRLFVLICMVLLSHSSEGNLVEVSVGRGCPRNWSKCLMHCESKGYNKGFCVRVACCCIPKVNTDYDLYRAYEEVKKKLRDMLGY